MKQISSFDLYFFTRELKEFIGSRLDTFFFDNNLFSIRLYQKFKGQYYIVSNMGKYIYLSTKREGSSSSTPFVQFLRKNISNAFISNIEQVDFERIIKFTIEKKKDVEITTYCLYLELFAPGNVILTDSSNKILNLLFRKNFKDRILKIKGDYILPPKRDLSIIDFDVKKFKESIKASELNLVKFLATALGIGGKYSEEICFICEINKNKAINEITDKEIHKIKDVATALLEKKINSKIVLNDKNEPINFIPFEFESIKSKNKESTTFNDSLKIYFNSNNEEKDIREVQFNNELKKLQNRLLKQQKMLEEVQSSYEKNNNIGNKIYENYAEIEELLKIAKNNINELDKNKLVKKVNVNNNEILIDI